MWRRWMKEYLPHIGSRHKWFLPTANLKEGDIVAIIDPNAARRGSGRSDEFNALTQAAMSL